MKKFIFLVTAFFLGFITSNIISLGFTKCLSNINWDIVQTLIAIGGFFFIVKQLEIQSIGNTITSLDILEKKWNSKEMMKKRSLLCLNIIKENSTIRTTDFDVLGFFEDFGIFVKGGAISIKNTWSMYGQSIDGYWNISKKHIAKLRKDANDSLYYENFEWLYDEIRKESGVRTCPHFVNEYNKDDIEAFAKGECHYLEKNHNISIKN